MTTRPLVPEDLQRSDAQPLERRSWCRAIAANALGTVRRSNALEILRHAWPRDERAALILRAATSPTSLADFPVTDIVGVFRSLAPGSAALALFERGAKLDLTGINSIRIPNVASWPPQPVF